MLRRISRKSYWSSYPHSPVGYREIDRSKYYSTPLVGIVTGDNDTHVSPCLAAGKLVTSLFDLIGDWDAVADALIEGEPRERVEDVEVL